ncbi:Uncharacterised protein [Klebsiella pneumoniae]|nr:Uncharacterised protein [Klebsiella pneumoniae]
MPLQVCISPFPESENLIYAFLHIVFTKGTMTGGYRFCDGARRLGFADCKQRNFF